MRICVTGHRGYIGSAFVDYAQRRAPWATWFLADKVSGAGRDVLREVCVEAIRDFRPDVIYNFAGSSGERQCAEDRNAWALNAVAPTVLASFCEPKIFVQASTCSLYGLGSLYTESKLWAEERLKLMAECNDRAIIAFRFGTVYGANPRTMRWDLPIHKMVKDAVEHGRITIPQARIMRPWLSLKDLVRVLWGVAQSYDDTEVAPKGFHVVPLVTENTSLATAAGAVLGGLSCPAAVEYVQNVVDRRNYMAPSVLSGRLQAREIREIEGLLHE